MKKLQCNIIQLKGWHHFFAIFTGNIPHNILQRNCHFELFNFCFENHIIQNIFCMGVSMGILEEIFQWKHKGSSIYDIHKKWPIFWTPYPHHLQKWTIDLFFKNNRIRKLVTNFKIPPPPFHVDIVNVWSLTFSPCCLTIKRWTYCGVYTC